MLGGRRARADSGRMQARALLPQRRQQFGRRHEWPAVVSVVQVHGFGHDPGERDGLFASQVPHKDLVGLWRRRIRFDLSRSTKVSAVIIGADIA
jgi:hypothetical protein